MDVQVGQSDWPLWLISLALAIGGCATTPEVPIHRATDEARQAMQILQEREQILASLRTEIASTRIAAAKQEAELQELRVTVVQLRQESRDSHEALVEAKRTLEARGTELAAIKTEREQLAQVSAQSGLHEQQLAVLQDTVASLSQELAQLKQILPVVTPQPTDDAAKGNGEGSTAGKGRRSDDQSVTRSIPRRESTERIIPAVHVLREEAAQSKPSWITVQPGESWWSLARKYHRTVKTLRAINGRVGDHLNVGEALRLP